VILLLQKVSSLFLKLHKNGATFKQVFILCGFNIAEIKITTSLKVITNNDLQILGKFDAG
jgi:hypothetical protein